jgi:hypothetical protein
VAAVFPYTPAVFFGCCAAYWVAGCHMYTLWPRAGVTCGWSSDGPIDERAGRLGRAGLYCVTTTFIRIASNTSKPLRMRQLALQIYVG